MPIPNQTARPSPLSTEPLRNVRWAVVSTDGPVPTIHRIVSREVEAALDAPVPLTADETRDAVMKKLQNLPPLPRTIVDIYALRRSPDPDRNKLLQIINNDPMTAGNLVKISNSVVYGLSKKVKTPDEALTFLGTRMVINVAMSTSMSAHLKPDLSPYGATEEAFATVSWIQGMILKHWREPRLRQANDDLQFAAFLQEIWALVASKIAIERKCVPLLQKALSENADRCGAEESVFWISTAEIASTVFSEWKFSPDIVAYIAGADHPDSVPADSVDGARALKIAKILAPLGGQRFSPDAIEKSGLLVSEWGFDASAFEKMVSDVTYKLDE